MADTEVIILRVSSVAAELISTVSCVAFEVKHLAESIYASLKLNGRRSTTTKLAVFYCLVVAQRLYIIDECNRVPDVDIGSEMGLTKKQMSKALTDYNGCLTDDIYTKCITSSSAMPLIKSFFTVNNFNSEQISAVMDQWKLYSQHFSSIDVNYCAAAFVYIYIVQLGYSIDKEKLIAYYGVINREFEIIITQMLDILQ
jgi:hypothetical protein